MVKFCLRNQHIQIERNWCYGAETLSSSLLFGSLGTEGWQEVAKVSNRHLIQAEREGVYVACAHCKYSGMYFLLKCMKVKRKWKSLSPVWLFATPWTIQSMKFSRPETGVGSLSLLQGIFPTRGSTQVSHVAGGFFTNCPKTLEWVVYPFSSRSSWPRNQTRVSCIAGRFFTNWAIKELVFKKKKKVCF